jgi:hypothetical protein
MANDVMVEDFPEQDQRAAVCNDAWDEAQQSQNTMVRVQSHQSAPARRESMDGREHLVLPVVMLVEGVHSGSGGPVYYPPEELARLPQAWNGRPVPVRHPEAQGIPLSCNAPEIMEMYSVGQLFNTWFDPERNRLVSEIWVDVELCRRKFPDVLARLEAGQMMEVSTGLWDEAVVASGVWNDEKYAYIARNIVPDHLALLPDQVGACSVADGCGTPRLHKENHMADQGTKEEKGLLARAKALFSQPREDEGMQALRERKALMRVLQEPSWTEIHEWAQRELDRLDSPGRIHFLEEMRDDQIVYSIHREDDVQYYRQMYEAQEDGIRLVGEPVRVRRHISYEPIETTNNSKEDNTMSKHEEKVTEIIAAPITNFTEEDREWLSTLSECQLSKLIPAAPENVTVYKSDPDKESLDVDALAKTLTERMAPQIEAAVDNRLGQVNEAQERKSLIGQMVRNGDWSAGDLDDIPMPALRKLARKAGAYYGLRATEDGGQDEPRQGPPPPPAVLTAKPENKED